MVSFSILHICTNAQNMHLECCMLPCHWGSSSKMHGWRIPISIPGSHAEGEQRSLRFGGTYRARHTASERRAKWKAAQVPQPPTQFICCTGFPIIPMYCFLAKEHNLPFTPAELLGELHKRILPDSDIAELMNMHSVKISKLRKNNFFSHCWWDHRREYHENTTKFSRFS